MFRLRLFALAGLLFASGCYSSQIYDPVTLPRRAEPAAPQIVIGDLQRDRDIITEQYEPFFAAIRRGMNNRFEQTGLARQAVLERDSLAIAAGTRRFLVRYRALDFSDATQGNVGKGVALGFCAMGLIPLCPFLGLMPQARERVAMTWEMRVFEVTGTTPTSVRDQDSNETLVSWDTSRLLPLVHREYDIALRAGHGRMNPEEALEFSREMAEEMAVRLLAASANDVARAIQNAPVVAPSPSPALTPSAAPTSVDVSSSVSTGELAAP